MGLPDVKIEIEVDDDGDTHQAYKDLEEEHRQEVARLNADVERRRQDLDRKLAETRRIEKAELQSRILELQEQCEVVELRFNDERHKRQLENGSLAPRIKKVFDKLQEDVDTNKSKYKSDLLDLQTEIEKRQADLSKVSIQIAEVDARMEGLKTDINDLLHRKDVAKEMHSISLTDLRRKVEEQKRHIDKDSEKLHVDLDAKNHSLELALKKLDEAYQENELKRKDYLAKSEKNLKHLKGEILRLHEFGTLIDNKIMERTDQLEREIKQMKENFEQTKLKDEKASSQLKDSCALKVSESQDCLDKQKADLLRVGRDLSNKLSEAAAAIKSIATRSNELDEEFDSKINELKREYEDAISHKQQVYQAIQERHEKALTQANKSFQDRQGDLKNQQRQIEEIESEMRKKHKTNGLQLKKDIAEKYQALQELVKQSKDEESNFLQNMGKLLVIVEDDKLRSNVVRPLIQRLENSSDRELNLVDSVYKSSETGFAHKIYEKDQELRQLYDAVRDVANAIVAQEYQLDSTFQQSFQDDDQTIKTSEKKIENLKCSIKTLKSEMELEDNKDEQVIMSKDDQLRQEREDHLQQKRRLYKELKRHKQVYNQNVENLHNKVKEAHNIQGALDKSKEDQIKEIMKQFAKNAEEQQAEVATLRKKIEDLKVSVQDTEDKIASFKMNPKMDPQELETSENHRDSKVTWKKHQLRNLQNKLYTIEKCEDAKKQPSDSEAINLSLSQLRQTNQELADNLEALSQQGASYDEEKDKFTARTNSIKKLDVLEKKLVAENGKLRQRRYVLLEKSKLRQSSKK